MKQAIEDAILLIMMIVLIGTCGMYHARKSDALVERYIERQIKQGVAL